MSLSPSDPIDLMLMTCIVCVTWHVVSLIVNRGLSSFRK